MAVRPSLPVVLMKHLINTILYKPRSRRSIAKILGIREITVGQWIKILHAKPSNLVYIAKYTRGINQGPYTEHFLFGPGEEDVPKPPAITPKEKAERERIRRKLSGIKPVLIHSKGYANDSTI